MECSVLSFFWAECKVSDTGSAHCWASSSFGHCVFCPFTDSDYPFGIFKLFLQVSDFVSCYHIVFVLSVSLTITKVGMHNSSYILRETASNLCMIAYYHMKNDMWHLVDQTILKEVIPLFEYFIKIGGRGLKTCDFQWKQPLIYTWCCTVN